MITRQPEWRYVRTIGSIDLPDSDGCLLFFDETGVYPPEIETYVALNYPLGGDDVSIEVEVSRVAVEIDEQEWWWQLLDDVASVYGYEVDEMKSELL